MWFVKIYVQLPPRPPTPCVVMESLQIRPTQNARTLVFQFKTLKCVHFVLVLFVAIMFSCDVVHTVEDYSEWHLYLKFIYNDIRVAHTVKLKTLILLHLKCCESHRHLNKASLLKLVFLHGYWSCLFVTGKPLFNAGWWYTDYVCCSFCHIETLLWVGATFWWQWLENKINVNITHSVIMSAIFSFPTSIIDMYLYKMRYVCSYNGPWCLLELVISSCIALTLHLSHEIFINTVKNVLILYLPWLCTYLFCFH